MWRTCCPGRPPIRFVLVNWWASGIITSCSISLSFDNILSFRKLEMSALAEATQETEAQLVCWWLYPWQTCGTLAACVVFQGTYLPVRPAHLLSHRGLASLDYLTDANSLCCIRLGCRCHGRGLGQAGGVLQWEERHVCRLWRAGWRTSSCLCSGCPLSPHRHSECTSCSNAHGWKTGFQTVQK